MKSILSWVALIAIVLLPVSTAGRVPTKKAKKGQSTTQVIFTGEIAKKVIGYAGPTPLNITVENGRIAKIEVLENQESPQYLKRAVNKVIPQFEGKTIDEALNLDADIATGATYSSEALIKNIKMGLESKKSSAKTSLPEKKTTKKGARKRK